jgi:NADH:quinone reductase (non-electrogenic)
VATLRGEGVKDYYHKSLGAVAGIGLGIGVFQSGKMALKGLPAWFAHRGYHGLAMPTWERKTRVIANWILNVPLGRDIVALEAVETPRAAFEEFASRPKPAVESAKAAETKTPAKAKKAPVADTVKASAGK